MANIGAENCMRARADWQRIADNFLFFQSDIMNRRRELHESPRDMADARELAAVWCAYECSRPFPRAEDA